MIEFIKHSFRFVALILLQVIVINNIEVSVLLNPMVIVLFIISLPFNTPKWMLLISAFLLGIIVDLFMNTPGILAFTSVLVAYLRPSILILLQPREGYFIGSSPQVSDLGWTWFLQFSIVLTFIFHLIYFIILGFSQDHFLLMLWKSIISTFFSLLVIFLFQLFTVKK